MRNPQHRRLDSRRGASVVEFALVFTLFLGLAVATFEFGRAVWANATVAHAAKSAARYAMSHGAGNMATPSNPGQTAQEATDEAIKQIAKDNAVGLPPGSLTVNVDWSPNNSKGSKVAVSVSYPFKFVAAPLLGVSDAMSIERTSKMIVIN